MLQAERTFIAIKSESIQRGLIGDFVTRFERRGMKLVACKMVVPTRELMESHYKKTDEWFLKVGTNKTKYLQEHGVNVAESPIDIGKGVQQALVNSFIGKPVLAMIWEGANAVALGRKTVGSTDPMSADIGSIRGDFTIESQGLAESSDRAIRTLIHASGSVDEGKDEIAMWFTPAEIIDYPLVLEEVLYGDNWGHCANYQDKV
ncbi:MAG: nucleoside-diphosphate kinase [candidate division WWE3 bacterium]|nr:nucleoside-diphosphate kinase [candidate division WWE3 bacterium]